MKSVTSLQSPHINTTKLLREQGDKDVFSMAVLPENMQRLFHRTKPKWTKMPVGQLAEFMPPIFHIIHIYSMHVYSILNMSVCASCFAWCPENPGVLNGNEDKQPQKKKKRKGRTEKQNAKAQRFSLFFSCSVSSSQLIICFYLIK